MLYIDFLKSVEAYSTRENPDLVAMRKFRKLAKQGYAQYIKRRKSKCSYKSRPNWFWVKNLFLTQLRNEAKARNREQRKVFFQAENLKDFYKLAEK